MTRHHRSAVVPPTAPFDGTELDADPRLEARHLTLGYERRTVVEDLSLLVPPGRVSVVVGANGSGKSTLLRGLARLLRPASGEVLLDGRDIHSLPSRDVARRLGLLPQDAVAPEGLLVRDLVGRGRHPHLGLLRRRSAEDDAAVLDAMALTGTTDLADRPVDELSGGQRQRVWVAMVLAQRTDLLLLVEPTTFLDLAHQVELLDVLRDLNRLRRTTVVMVLHELNLAARYADHLVALKRGRVVAQGDPREVVTPGLVADVFGLEARVVPDPVTGTPLVVPIGRHRPVPSPEPGRSGLERSKAPSDRPGTGRQESP